MIQKLLLAAGISVALVGLAAPAQADAQASPAQFVALTGGGGPSPGGGLPSNPDTIPGGGSTIGGSSNCEGGVAGFVNFRSWDACLAHDDKGVPQIRSLEDVGKIGIMVVEFFMKLIGYVSVGFIVWGGIKYLKSQGEPGETAAARQIITNALMGLVLAVMAVAIIQFIVGIF